MHTFIARFGAHSPFARSESASVNLGTNATRCELCAMVPNPERGTTQRGAAQNAK